MQGKTLCCSSCASSITISTDWELPPFFSLSLCTCFSFVWTLSLLYFLCFPSFCVSALFLFYAVDFNSTFQFLKLYSESQLPTMHHTWSYYCSLNATNSLCVFPLLNPTYCHIFSFMSLVLNKWGKKCGKFTLYWSICIFISVVFSSRNSTVTYQPSTQPWSGVSVTVLFWRIGWLCSQSFAYYPRNNVWIVSTNSFPSDISH